MGTIFQVSRQDSKPSRLTRTASGSMMRGFPMARARRLASNALRAGPSFVRCPYKGATFALQSRSLNIAVEGCCHGELDAIYSHVNHLENRHNYKVDALLICGDFQAMRNKEDVGNMACPTKYKVLGGFHRYYTGQKKAPMLTIVIGGNHEASNYMWELYHGGWLAPNIYFLGHAGCIQLNGIRIAGISGIYNENHYNLGTRYVSQHSSYFT